MQIEIDHKSGFCFGVQRAVDTVSEHLNKSNSIYCLGKLVHNPTEVARLENNGLKTIKPEGISEVQGKAVLIRSHGEPPHTYLSLKNNNNEIIDATCPVVLKLQKRIKNSYDSRISNNEQIVIFGKLNHPETIGLLGQTQNNAIVITENKDLKNIDFNQPIELYCQTTMPIDGFQEIKEQIRSRANNKVIFHDTICRQVANRAPHLSEFAKKYDLVVFVSGKESSNGKFLFNTVKASNSNSYHISSVNDIENAWIKNNIKSIGIAGATSTPQWQLKKVKAYIESIT